MMACLLIMVLLPGLDAQGAFVEGNSLYMDGKFEEALDIYMDGRLAGEESGLFLFNAGNCLFRLGRFGEAVHRYLSALHYLPRNGDVRTNLELVRRRLSLEETSYPGRWRFFTPVDLVCLGMLFACPAILLLAFRFRRSSLILFVISAALVAASLVPGSRYAVAVRPSPVPAPTMTSVAFAAAR